MQYKKYLSETFPLLANLYKQIRLYKLKRKSTQQVFYEIYKKNTWPSSESVSGPGSALASTVNIRQELPELFASLRITTLLDLPCGDFNWMKEINFKDVQYIGGDIVSELIEKNKSKYTSDHIFFQTINLLEDILPEVDILLCRDCMVHLSFNDIHKAILNISRSKITYILTTTFPNSEKNIDIITGRWRKLNLEKAPFVFPKPKLLIEENNRQDSDRKCMGLWFVRDIHFQNNT